MEEKENELRERAYRIACDHGWHDERYPDTHWVMMIITEIAEAVQADRKNKHADRDQYVHLMYYAMSEDLLEDEMKTQYETEAFENLIKDTYEDELADICIRCYDFAGLLNYDFGDIDENDRDTLMGIKQGDYDEFLNLPVPQFMCYIIHLLDTTYTADFDMIRFALYMIAEYAAKNNIPLLWYIEEKMKYNEKRTYKHGCKY